MKEADIFESWINSLTEGTWALPDTPEKLNKLKEMMSTELIVGPDATNATEQLYDVVGDDVLFDRLSELAKDTNGKANIWEDSEVQARLQELGVDTSSIGEPTAAPGSEPGIQPEEPIAPTQDMPQEPAMAPVSEAEETFESLNAIRKAAGLPVAESVLTDSTGHTLDHILKRFSREVADFKENGELRDDLYHALYDYYFDDMPYGTKKARDGDPYEWIADRLADELGVNEGMLDEVDFDSLNQMASHAVNALGQGGAGVAAAATGAALGGLVGKGIEKTSNYFQKKKQDKAYDNLKQQANEGSCNATMEGEYCPEHGLMECGSYMESMGGTVAGAVAPMEEGQERDQYYYKRNNIWRVMDGDELVDEYTPARYEVVGAKKLLAQYDDDNIDVTHVISPMGTVTYLYGKPEMDEGNDDPINSNSAITGAYYESKSDDALLARIKSLALIK